MSDRQPIKTYYLGTAVKITVMLNVDTVTSAKITIDDPSENEKVSSTTMTKEANKVYSYVWQSSTDYDDGDYVITITVVYGGYTSITQTTVSMIDLD